MRKKGNNMAIITADGDKLIECGEDIIKLCDEYNMLISDLFEKLYKINNYWSGSSADSYKQRILLDKSQYLLFGNHLKNYGKVLSNTGKNINYVVKKWGD